MHMINQGGTCLPYGKLKQLWKRVRFAQMISIKSYIQTSQQVMAIHWEVYKIFFIGGLSDDL